LTEDSHIRTGTKPFSIAPGNYYGTDVINLSRLGLMASVIRFTHTSVTALTFSGLFEGIIPMSPLFSNRTVICYGFFFLDVLVFSFLVGEFFLLSFGLH